MTIFTWSVRQRHRVRQKSQLIKEARVPCFTTNPLVGSRVAHHSAGPVPQLKCQDSVGYVSNLGANGMDNR